MKYFDLHCDTLCECYEKEKTFYGNDLHIDLEQAGCFSTYIQCCAAWIPDQYRGEEAYRYFLKLRALLPDKLICTSSEKLKSLAAFGGVGLIPTIEGGSVLGGRLDRILDIARLGIKMLTLTWNANNEIGGGIGEDNLGLTPFGKKAVVALEQANILIDVSHASRALFDDICAFTTKPFLASHSNAKKLCGHQRNLSESQIKEIVHRGGLIGINFCRDFLEDLPEKASIVSIVKQIEFFFSHGCENILAFGSDFDGCGIPKDMAGISAIPLLWEELSKRGYSDKLLSKLFFGNAYSFLLDSFDR